MCSEIQSQCRLTGATLPDTLPPGVPPASVTHLIASLDACDSHCEMFIMACLAELKDTPWAPYLQQALMLTQTFDFAAAKRMLAASHHQLAQENSGYEQWKN